MVGSQKKSSKENTIQKPSLGEQCQKRGFLDGTWFVPDLQYSISTSVSAKCQLCTANHAEPVFISGAVNAISNFKSHIQVINLECKVGLLD